MTPIRKNASGNSAVSFNGWNQNILFFFFFYNFSEQCMVWPWGEFLGTSTPGKISNFHLWIIFLIVEWETWNYLERSFKPFPDWWVAKTWMLQNSKLQKLLLYIYRWSVNQVHLISSTWLLVTLVISMEAIKST